MLGAELRGARATAKMTQEELAFKAGVDRTSVSQLEHDKKSPTVAVLFRICHALGVAVSKVIARVEAAKRRG